MHMDGRSLVDLLRNNGIVAIANSSSKLVYHDDKVYLLRSPDYLRRPSMSPAFVSPRVEQRRAERSFEWCSRPQEDHCVFCGEHRRLRYSAGIYYHEVVVVYTKWITDPEPYAKWLDDIGRGKVWTPPPNLIVRNLTF